jgi:hypothetical protein
MLLFASVMQWVPRLTNTNTSLKNIWPPYAPGVLGLPIHTQKTNSWNIFNGQWNSIEHFPALSVTLVSNWVLTKECNWKSKKRKQAQKYRCLRSGWMWMKFPETSIFDELVRREKFQLLWTATTLLVKQLSIHGFQSTAKWKRQDVLKRTYVQLIWPCRCCFFSRKYAGYMRFLDNLLSSFQVITAQL